MPQSHRLSAARGSQQPADSRPEYVSCFSSLLLVRCVRRHLPLRLPPTKTCYMSAACSCCDVHLSGRTLTAVGRVQRRPPELGTCPRPAASPPLLATAVGLCSRYRRCPKGRDGESKQKKSGVHITLCKGQRGGGAPYERHVKRGGRGQSVGAGCMRVQLVQLKAPEGAIGRQSGRPLG